MHDDFDRGLIAFLREDARAITQLAHALKISRATAQARLGRLVENGTILGFTARVHTARDGQGTHALMMVEVRPTSSSSVSQFMKDPHSLESVWIPKACLPIFGGGDHCLSSSTLPAMAQRAQRADKPLFVLWIDAHTPHSSMSGNLHGTSLAYVTGKTALLASRSRLLADLTASLFGRRILKI